MIILFFYIVGFLISYLIILRWEYYVYEQGITIGDLIVTFFISLLSWGFIIVILISFIPWNKIIFKRNNLKK